MPNPIMFQKLVLAAAAETTFGTALTLTSSHAGFRVIDRDFKINGDTVQRERQGGLGVDANIGGVKPTSEATFKTHIAGKGTTGPPYWSLFMQGCGFSLTSSTLAATSDSSLWKGLSMGAFIDGRRMLGRGMMGNAKITLEAGMPGVIDWSFKGGWAQDPDDTAILTGMTYEAATPPIWAGAGSLLLGGVSTYTKVSKLEIDLGCDIQFIEDPNSPGGVLGGWIANRITKVTMDPLATAFAVKNFYADSRANTTIALSAVLGTVTNNITTIACANLQVDGNPTNSNSGGKLRDNVSFLVNADDLSMVFS